MAERTPEPTPVSASARQSGDTIMSDPSGKTVLVTGALTGIGRATALAFAQEGSRVMVSGRRDDAGQALVTELRALGAEAEFVRADVRREDDVRNLVGKTVERFGRLDVAVNNAGTDEWRHLQSEPQSSVDQTPA